MAYAMTEIIIYQGLLQREIKNLNMNVPMLVISFYYLFIYRREGERMKLALGPGSPTGKPAV